MYFSGWAGFLRKNEDPNWKVEVAGIDFGKSQRYIVMCVITLVIIFSFLGQVVFSVMGKQQMQCHVM